MKKQRIVALGLTAILAFNSSIPAFALEEHRQEKRATEKTVVITADTLPGQLIPLNRESTTMLDNGDALRNVDGEVDTEIQGTYQRNQTLVSSSLAGTSFSFAPIMLDDYYPTPSDTPEPSETPEPSVSPEVSVSPSPSISPLPSASPEASVTPALSESPTPESSSTPALPHL